MLPDDPNTKSEVLSLERIALWYDGTTVDEQSRTRIDAERQTVGRVEVPVLQRGLVWRPHQVEMFWDSLLRGFPVGSLVLCRKIEGQMRKPPDGGQARKSGDGVTHHLLDGQQRCDAIRLGFTDPFLAGGDGDPLAPVLWLDLNPNLPDNTTREYLARITTSAHPWGYRNNDSADRISAAEMRKAQGGDGRAAQEGHKRPSPWALSPYFSKAPVPLAWLAAAETPTAAALRDQLLRRLEALSSDRLNWPCKTIKFLTEEKGDDLDQKLDRIRSALVRAKGTTIVALMAPDGLLDETTRESRCRGLETAQDVTDISNVEHLFQRLNQLGTPLNGEELAYSMIKAYWPKLATHVDGVKNRHMPASRMVALAVRVALADEKIERLPQPLGVSQIRSLAGKEDRRITGFVIGNGNGPLARASSRVEKWLRYSDEENPAGFLPVQLTRFAMKSPDLYLLLLWIANRAVDASNNPDEDGDLAKAARLLISWGHWFASDKGKLANRIYAECVRNGPSFVGAITQGLKAAREGDDPLLAPLPKVEEFEKFLALPQEGVEEWDWSRLANDKNGNPDKERRQILDRVVFRVIWNKDLLLYAQRRYLAETFGDYDPSEKDMWEDYNCP